MSLCGRNEAIPQKYDVSLEFYHPLENLLFTSADAMYSLPLKLRPKRPSWILHVILNETNLKH